MSRCDECDVRIYANSGILTVDSRRLCDDCWTQEHIEEINPYGN